MRDDAALLAQASGGGACIALDPLGRTVTSEEFSKLMYTELERGGSRLSFIIGGAEGLPPELRAQASLLSLSRMTFTCACQGPQ